MQRITRHITDGYFWYVGGVVHASKAVQFADKMTDRFKAGLGETQRWRYRQAGRANAFFLIHPTYRGPDFQWWLMLTAGDHPQKHTEKLWNNVRLRRQHLVAFGQYESVRLHPDRSKIRGLDEGGRSRKIDPQNPPWTWRLVDAEYETYQTKIRNAVRRKRDSKAHLIGVFVELSRLPGFREIRGQVYDLRSFAAEEWGRIKAAGEPLPDLPPVGWWVRMQKAPMIPLEVVAGRLLQGLPPYPAELLLQQRRDVSAPPGDGSGPAGGRGGA